MTSRMSLVSATALITISDTFGINAPYEKLEKLLEAHKLQELARFPCVLVQPKTGYWHGGVLLGFGEAPDRNYNTPPSVTYTAAADQSAFSNAMLGIPALLLTLFQIAPGAGSPAGRYVYLPGGNQLYGVDELFRYKEVTLE